jgi:hypothetical protein
MTRVPDDDTPEIDGDDFILTIDHPMGRLETTLVLWIERGPGPRDLVRPIAVRSRATGEELPLTVIPLRYRNDEESRRLIAEGEIESPW